MSLSPCFETDRSANTELQPSPSYIEVASTYGSRAVCQQTKRRKYATPDAVHIVRSRTSLHACVATRLDDSTFSEYAAPGKRVIAVLGTDANAEGRHYIMYAAAGSLHCCICGADFRTLQDGMAHYGVSTTACSAVELKLSGAEEGEPGKAVMVAFNPPRSGAGPQVRVNPFRVYLEKSTAARAPRFDLLPQVAPRTLTRSIRKASDARAANKAKIAEVIKKKLAPDFRERRMSREEYKMLARDITSDAFEDDPDGEPESAALQAWSRHRGSPPARLK